MADEPQPGDAQAALGAEPGLCADCLHAKVNATRRGTAYLRCLRAEWDERLPRYPRLPVGSCPGFERAERP
jgi:propionyl-CoA synthetase